MAYVTIFFLNINEKSAKFLPYAGFNRKLSNTIFILIVKIQDKQTKIALKQGMILSNCIGMRITVKSFLQLDQS